MTEIGVGFGIALAGATVLAAIPRERLTTLTVIALLWIGWTVNVNAIAPYGVRYNYLSPALDVLCGFAVALLIQRLPRVWLIGVFFAYLTQLLCHAIFYTLQSWWGENPAMLHRYQLAVNILLGVQIGCVGWPGGWRAGGAVLDLLLFVSRLRRRSEAPR